MRALILGSSSAGPLKEMLDRRHSWGADRHDEVWRGVLHLDLLRSHADLAQESQAVRAFRVEVAQHGAEEEAVHARSVFRPVELLMATRAGHTAPPVLAPLGG